MTIKKIRQENRPADRQSEALQEFFGSLNLTFNKGAFLTEINSEGVETDIISLSTTPKNIPHRLNVRYSGFFIIERSTGATIFNTRNADDQFFIRLTSSASTTARIWVF